MRPIQLFSGDYASTKTDIASQDTLPQLIKKLQNSFYCFAETIGQVQKNETQPNAQENYLVKETGLQLKP